MPFAKGVSAPITMPLINFSTGAAITSGTVNVRVAKDLASLGTGTATHLGGGQWTYTLSAGDMVDNSVGVVFAHSSGRAQRMLITNASRGKPLNLFFLMLNRTSGAIIFSGTVTGTVSQDGGAQAAMTNAPQHLSEGMWGVLATGDETDADFCSFLFSHADGMTTEVVVSFRTHDGSDAIQDQILQAVQTKIRDLALSGIDNDSIIIQKKPSARRAASSDWPIVVIAPQDPVVVGPYSSARESVKYPILVAVADVENQDQTTNRNRHLLWLQQIRRAFVSQHLAGVPAVWNCQVTPRSSYAGAFFEYGLSQGAMLLTFDALEARE